MCEKKLKLLFLLAALLSFSSLFSSPLTGSGSTSPQSAELLLQPLPVFPVADGLLSIPAPTPTEKPLTLNERTARQLEAWIAYYGTVKDYVTRVNDWSIQVQTSWNQVKVSLTSYEAQTQLQIKIRDEIITERDKENARLKADRYKYMAWGVLAGFGAGLFTGMFISR